MWESITFASASLVLAGWYMRRALREEQTSTALLEATVEVGLDEPDSLHPVIDETQCIGCGSCVSACPEGKVLGMVDGRPKLVEPTSCIGHGACRTACPSDAIQLVFGTATRGVDIPFVAPNFETNVPGLFIAGELGGMGLIRNAVEQGRQAIEGVRRLSGIGRGQDLDTLIVGAGPAGFSASLAALERGLRYVTVEQETLGGTVAHYPRGKIVMTAPVQLPLVGRVQFRETSKERLLEFWKQTESSTGVQIRYGERLERIERRAGGFDVHTTRGAYRTRSVVLTIGRRGTPRKLGVPGEESSKVVYRLSDAAQYRGRHVLVVGGGDSALEAAASLSEESGTTVTLSYRSEAFKRAKPKNRHRVDRASAEGRLRVLLKSNVLEILPDRARLEQGGRPIELRNDDVIVCAGGILPTGFLRSLGIEIETKYGTA